MADQISDKYQCIFVHIPKTGGTSIEQSTLFNARGSSRAQSVGGHRSAMAFQRKYPDQFKAYLKFTLVRNPYDRLVSAYFWIARGGSGNIYDNAIFEKHFKERPINFHAFCKSQLPELINDLIHLKPQYHFACDEQRNLLVDTVVRQEDFRRGIKKVFKQLGAPYAYRHTSRSQHRHYASYYTPETQQLVLDLYQHDFTLFDYPPIPEKPNRLKYFLKKKSDRVQHRLTLATQGFTGR